MSAVMKYDVVDQAIADGKLWKAKEVLQGRLASPEFDPDVLRRYGEVLLAMGDMIEAGRMLFGSGVRRPEYSEAIELFLSRNRRDVPTRFLAALPLMVRRQDQLAGFIASPEFEVSGWTPEAIGSIPSFIPKGPKVPTTWRQRVRERTMNALGIAVAIFVSISFMVGVITIIRTIWSILAG